MISNNSKLLNGETPGHIYCIYVADQYSAMDLNLTIKESFDYGVTWVTRTIIAGPTASNTITNVHIDVCKGLKSVYGSSPQTTYDVIYFIVSVETEDTVSNNDIYFGWYDINNIDTNAFFYIDSGQSPSLAYITTDSLEYVYEKQSTGSRVYRRTLTPLSNGSPAATLGSNVQLDYLVSPARFINPKIVINDSLVRCVVYYKNTNAGNASNIMTLLFTKSNDGTTWDTPTSLTPGNVATNNEDVLYDKFYPALYLDSNNYLHILFTYFKQTTAIINEDFFPYRMCVGRYLLSYNNGTSFNEESIYDNNDYILLSYDIKETSDGEFVISTSTISHSKSIPE